MKKEEVQQKVILYQLLQKHLEGLRQQILENERRFLEIQTTQQAMKDFEKKKGTDALIPLGSGCFANAQMTDVSKVLMDVGGGIVVKKTISEVKTILDEKEKDVGAVSERVQNEVNQIIKQMNDIATEINEAQK